MTKVNSSNIKESVGLNEEEKIELTEWMASLDYVLKHGSVEKAQKILEHLQIRAQESGVTLPFTVNTPYINTIHKSKQKPYPGNREIERQIKSIIRWNAMAMVVRSNRQNAGIGGHISTYASAATLYEVGFNHFFRARGKDFTGDLVYFQGHASPGIYARAFLEGRFTEKQLQNFRRELSEGGGLSSYPHPWLMPGFWQFPTVSMGLGPLMGIYQARFMRYLEDRGLKKPGDEKVWVFMGDGESDEPESLGAITMASREKLDNLIFVINCNLQRLDGPVRGNGKIIQELEAIFRGAKWNVIKVIWSEDWDLLLEKDVDGFLAKRMGEVVDGQYQKYVVEDGAYIRDHFFGAYPELLDMVKNVSDETLQKMRRGGHDPEKVYAAYLDATQFKGAPTVILAKTIKGYGMGESGEGKNITHQQKKLNEEELKQFRTRFKLPISDRDIHDAPFYKLAPDSEEMKYLQARRKILGGYLPERKIEYPQITLPRPELFSEFEEGTGEREVSTTMAYVRILAKLLKDEDVGKNIVPIIPDEARTFGMEALFRSFGIYSHVGQLYDPVDSDSLLYYKEIKEGQILEEGINEAGALSSFVAAGTAYANYGIQMIPFYTYYSMFGPQRVGDLIWAGADSRCRGFLVGATSGRTALNGEGLQHQDGHSPLLMSTIPNVRIYHPAFAFDLSTIIADGLKKMVGEEKDIFYYLTVANENYKMPALPASPPLAAKMKNGILKGMYLYRPARIADPKFKINILGSGSIILAAEKAQSWIESTLNIGVDLWNVTSYTELRRDALEVERFNRLNPEGEHKTAFVAQELDNGAKLSVAASDFMKALPDGVSQWIPSKLVSLGTDGFGRSESRELLRDFFEVNENHIAWAVVSGLFTLQLLPKETLLMAQRELGIVGNKPNPVNG
jgi:pyruvate dehydrogenase E1 component